MSESDGEVKVKPPKAKKEKISRYFLTINSNRTPEQLGDEGTNEFKRRIKALFDNFHLFIQVRQGYEPDPNMTVKKLYAYEVGEHPQGGRYHCHAVVSVHHNSNVPGVPEEAAADLQAVRLVCSEHIHSGCRELRSSEAVHGEGLAVQ